ncbi:MAG: hypothetical protein LBC97_15640 [Bifidobacteriaceae bacterium]|nr:hypothetical protein [Bifidobacteriaceae bacterium]
MAIETHQARGRVHDGDTDTMHDAVHKGWRRDLAEGRSSVLAADDRRAVAVPNDRAREDRIQAGAADPGRSAGPAEGVSASVGDVVITRRNAVAGSTSARERSSVA